MRCAHISAIFIAPFLAFGAFADESAINPIEVRTEFASDAVVTTVSHNAMGTAFTITLVGTPGQDSPSSLARVAREAFAEIDALEARISSWRSASQTSQVNRYAFERPVRVTPDVASFLLEAQRIYRDTGGAFDCTIGPLIDLWRKARESDAPPPQSKIDEIRAQIGFDKVQIDAESRTVRFTSPGIQLNFGAIGKGNALDVAAETLARYGVTTALLDGGASTFLATAPPPGQPGWTVRVKDPYNGEEVLVETVLTQGAFSTSSNAEKGSEAADQRFGHILDPRTGRPARGKLLAMSLTDTAAEADALSTAFFVLDVEAIRAYCRANPAARAIVVTRDDTGNTEETRINFEQRGSDDE